MNPKTSNPDLQGLGDLLSAKQGPSGERGENVAICAMQD
jgi:hypothetical protein